MTTQRGKLLNSSTYYLLLAYNIQNKNKKLELGLEFVDPSIPFRGMNYSDIVREWLIWLHSDSPVYRGYKNEILFLHGNLSYFTDPETHVRKQAEKFQNRAIGKDMFRGQIILVGTPVFIPVTSAFYSVGETHHYSAKKLESVIDCQYAARKDIEELGRIWCNIKRKDSEEIDLINRKYVHYAESTSFQLPVAENSPVRHYLEIPIGHGTFSTYACAYAALINFQSPGVYRIQVRGPWANDVYD